MPSPAESPENREGFAEESLANWTPRFVANGVPHDDVDRLQERIESWADWCSAFSAIGEEYAELGEDAISRGDEESAGEHLARASMCYHFGSHVWHVDEDRRDLSHRRAVELFGRGGAYLDPPVQRVEAPYGPGGFDVPGNLRVPERGPDGNPGDSPLVVLLPGLDSIKEELDAYADDFHRRGIATLAVDGAGQGETWYEHGMSPEYPSLISTVVDHVEELDPTGVDVTRLGVYGVSLGGFYAPYVASHDDRFDACVGVSGPFTVGPVSPRASGLLKEQFLWACKTDSLLEVDEITESMSLRGDISELSAPTLALTGANDTIVSPEQTQRIAERAPGGEYVLYDRGNHVCNNIPRVYRPRAADWLRAAIA